MRVLGTGKLRLGVGKFRLIFESSWRWDSKHNVDLPVPESKNRAVPNLPLPRGNVQKGVETKQGLLMVPLSNAWNVRQIQPTSCCRSEPSRRGEPRQQRLVVFVECSIYYCLWSWLLIILAKSFADIPQQCSLRLIRFAAGIASLEDNKGKIILNACFCRDSSWSDLAWYLGRPWWNTAYSMIGRMQVV